MEGAVPAVAMAVAIVALIVAGLALFLSSRDRRVAPDGSIAGARQAELERRLSQVSQRLEVLEEDLDSSDGSAPGAQPRSSASVIRRSGSPISHIGLTRFDAFDDTGGGQSFALALIDDDGDGIVLTSLHSRQSTRVYVKDIRGGVADAPLSDEEERALRGAGLRS